MGVYKQSIVKAPIPPRGLNTSPSGGARPYYFDGFRRKLVPDDNVLLREYKRVIYTCCNLNVNRVCTTPLRLYIKRENNNSAKKSLLRKGIETRTISSKKKDFLSSNATLQKALKQFVDIEEVVVHPSLNVLQKGNRLPFFNGQRLFEITQLFQELIGRAYILVENDPILGIPSDLWVLPAHWVKPRSTKKTSARKVIDYYELCPPGFQFNDKNPRYKPEDVLSFLMPNPLNPYVDGISPLAAAFDVNDVASKQLSLENSLLDNEGRPDLVFTPKGDSTIGSDEAKRFEREYRTRFARGRTGGVWVMEDPMDMEVLNFPPRELARLEIHKVSKNEIANAYGVPYAMISDASHNREQLEACEIQHAKHSTVPRLNRNIAILNDPDYGFISRFDETGELFFAYDDPIPENEEIKVTKIRGYVQDGIWTPNEGRKEDGTYGESNDEEANKLRRANVPEAGRSGSRGMEDSTPGERKSDDDPNSNKD